MELPFFFENNTNNIFGILHSPDKKDKHAGFIFCYPFAYEGDCCRRIYAQFARRLASIGYYVLRFSYMGTGDSSGNAEDATVETHISDITKAINILKERSNAQRIGLLGMRLGATWAGLAAVEPINKVNPLILWDPILDVKKYFDNSFRQSITFQNTLFHKILFDRKQIIERLISDGKIEYDGYQLNTIDGYIVSQDFYTQSVNLDILSRIKDYSGDVLIIQIDKNTAPFRPELVDLVNICRCETKIVELLHVNESVSWWSALGEKWVSEPDQIFDATEDWISKVILD